MSFKVLDQFTEAHWPVKQCDAGFEGRVLLTAWIEQLRTLINDSNTHCADINKCIIRIGDIAHEVTVNSRPNRGESHGAQTQPKYLSLSDGEELSQDEEKNSG